MSNTSNLANLFSHLQNSQKNHILMIEFPQSKLILSILGIFQECGYIRGFRVCNPVLVPHCNPPKIEILLKYKNQRPAINKILCISKPSKRIYLSVKQLSHILTKKSPRNLSSADRSLGSSSLLFMKGILILSTSKGIMTHLTAYRLNLGGLLLCHIS